MDGCGACACQSQYLANGLHILNIGRGREGKGEQGQADRRLSVRIDASHGQNKCFMCV